MSSLVSDLEGDALNEWGARVSVYGDTVPDKGEIK